jgi:hypothetical protein
MKTFIVGIISIVGLILFLLFASYKQTMANKEFVDRCTNEGGFITEVPSTQIFTRQWGCNKLGIISQ